MIKALLMTFHRPLSFLDYYRRSFELVKQEPADVYHAHDLNTLPVAYWAKRRLGGKLIYDSHELYTERNVLRSANWFSKYLTKKMEYFLIHRADAVITVSYSIAKELSQRYGIVSPYVVMNAPSLLKKPSYHKNFSLRSHLGIPNRYTLLLYSGGITFGRGLPQIIQSLQYLPYCYFVVMGYGSSNYIQHLKKLAIQYGVSSRISFFGPVPPEDVVSFIASADLGIAAIENTCLSYYYCSPNKLFEYIAAGIPVVGSDFPELRRIIKGYNIGETFNPEDPKDIARAINYVLSDKTRYEEMKKNAQKAAQIFNWENESKKLLDIYRLMEKTKDA